jgi:hypothetical protein
MDVLGILFTLGFGGWITLVRDACAVRRRAEQEFQPPASRSAVETGRVAGKRWLRGKDIDANIAAFARVANRGSEN